MHAVRGRLKGGVHGFFKGVYLSGKNGCGKTHLAGAVWNELRGNGIVGVFVVAADYLDLKKRAMDDKTLKPAADEMFAKARNAPLLILDDLGAEKCSEWTDEQLYILIDARYRNGLPIIVTSNYRLANGKNDIAARVGPRSFSRLFEMTDAFWIDAPDYRLRKAKANGQS